MSYKTFSLKPRDNIVQIVSVVCTILTLKGIMMMITYAKYLFELGL